MLKGALAILAVFLVVRGIMWLCWKLVPGLRRTSGANRDTRKTKKQKSNILRRTDERVPNTSVRTSRTQFR